MPSIRTKPGSKYLYACVTLPNGKRRQFSTRTTDESAAMEIAIRAENLLAKQRDELHLRSALSRLVEDVIGTPAEDPAAWLETWAERKSREVAPRTAAKYKQVIAAVSSRLRLARIDTFSALTSSEIINQREAWARLHSPSTVNNYLKILRIALNDAQRDRLLAENPAALVRGLKIPAGQKVRAFTPAEISALLDVSSAEWRAYILTALYTGQRRGDLAALTWARIDLQEEKITFLTSKTGRHNTIPLVNTALDALLTLPIADHPPFPVFPTIHAMSGQAISAAFRRLMAEAGLVEPREHYKGPRRGGKTPSRRLVGPISFHSLRHTATSFLKAAGVSDGVTQAIIGHASKAQSDHYTHIDLDTLRLGIQKMETRLNSPAP